jgi:hypothetical protein
VVGAIHELPLPQVQAIVSIAYHTCIQQRPISYSVFRSTSGRGNSLIAPPRLLCGGTDAN